MDTDFCVVGGGPAGLTLSLLLVRSGADVVLLEKSPTLDREYRGEILQPGGMQLLQELEVLDNARKRGSYELSRFQLVEGGRVLMDIDYRQLPKPFDFLLSMPQQHLIEELLDQCSRYPNFHYHKGGAISGLLTDRDKVTGVHFGEQSVRARCVIGADGRFSKTRKVAGISYTRLEAFEHDVLWLKIPGGDRSRHDVRVSRSAGSPVLMYDAYPGQIQLGWTLPHKGYQAVAEKGVDHVKAQLALAVPQYRERIDAAVGRLSDFSLLDVYAGTADEWVRDGLVLIGDAAHTHGPIGAQGINLAIQDAVLLHPILMAGLDSGDFSREALLPYETERRPDIAKVMKLQSRQGKGMLSQGAVATRVRPAIARLLAHTPIYRKILNAIAFGFRPIQVRSDLFTEGRARVCG